MSPLYKIGSFPGPGQYRCFSCAWTVDLGEDQALPDCIDCTPNPHAMYVRAVGFRFRLAPRSRTFTPVIHTPVAV